MMKKIIKNQKTIKKEFRIIRLNANRRVNLINQQKIRELGKRIENPSH